MSGYFTPSQPATQSRRPASVFRVLDMRDDKRAEGQGGSLRDNAAQRKVRYLRLSVTDRCNLRCRYCMPEQGVPFAPKKQLLTFEEITRIVRCFVALGIDHIKVTGGEPLLRRGLPDLIGRLNAIPGIADISLTTNALGLKGAASQLRRAGLRRINVSLDTLNRARFESLTRRDRLANVLAGLEAAAAAGFTSTKLNVVVIGGTNCDELAELIDFAWATDLVVRFIEYMPIGLDGHWSSGTFVPVSGMFERLSSRFEIGESLGYGAAVNLPGAGPARYHTLRRRSDGVSGQVGFITAVSHDFCGDCNRVRLTAQGALQECLAFPGTLSLRDVVRRGGSDEDLIGLIRQGVWGKHPGHEFRVDGGGKHVYQPMSVTGG